MTTYKVTGGTPLRGQVQLRGAKNSGFKAMIAALLADSPSEISNLSLISEIGFAEKVITSLGGKVEIQKDPHNLTIDPTNLSSFEIPFELGSKSRSSTMYVGPLLKKFGKAVMPVPGGDIAIGKRPLDRHFAGLEALGAKIEHKDGKYFVEAPYGLTGATYKFSKNTHTGTETLLMCAVFAKGTTVLENAAEEPEVDNLIDFLRHMGADIERSGRTIKINGVDSLHGANHEIMNDRLEAAALGCFALATKGTIEILGANPDVLAAFLEKVEEVGGKWEKTDKGVVISSKGNLKATDMTTGIYPGFMTDWQPTWTALMTQAVGESIVHETVMDSRFGFVPDLNKMGAHIEFFSPDVEDPDTVYNFNIEELQKIHPHAVKIMGPTPLTGTELEIDDIRRGASILLAGMVASGTTTILDSKDQITRGYEDLVGKLTSLGAKIDVN